MERTPARSSGSGEASRLEKVTERAMPRMTTAQFVVYCQAACARWYFGRPLPDRDAQAHQSLARRRRVNVRLVCSLPCPSRSITTDLKEQYSALFGFAVSTFRSRLSSRSGSVKVTERRAWPVGHFPDSNNSWLSRHRKPFPSVS